MANKKGTKYVKLRGGETATPESAKEARAFMGWYGQVFDKLRDKPTQPFDDQIATETALKIYEAIELKGLRIKGKYMGYFLRAYNLNYILEQKRQNAERARTVPLDPYPTEAHYSYITKAVYDSDAKTLLEVMPAPPELDEDYEHAVDQLRGEILEFVRKFYPPFEVSLFEIYMELQPDVSYKKMASMLGISAERISTAIGAIKKDVVYWFADRRAFLLSRI